MEDGSLEKAIKYVNKALRYNTNSLRALILLGDTSFANKNFTDALKKYLAAYEKYPEASYLVLKKIKKTHDNLNNNGNFLDFIKSIAHVNSPIDIFSNIDKNLSQELDSREIFELYEKEFSNNRVDLSQLSEYLNLIKENKIAFDNKSLNNIKNCVDNYKTKKNDIHKCTQCGYKSINHSWQCPSCHKWASIEKNFQASLKVIIMLFENKDESKIIVAFDFESKNRALLMAKLLDPSLCKIKVGLELYVSCGPSIIEELHSLGYKIFLDLKFHDITNTVVKSCLAASKLGVWMINIHSSGGVI